MPKHKLSDQGTAWLVCAEQAAATNLHVQQLLLLLALLGCAGLQTKVHGLQICLLLLHLLLQCLGALLVLLQSCSEHLRQILILQLPLTLLCSCPAVRDQVSSIELMGG